MKSLLLCATLLFGATLAFTETEYKIAFTKFMQKYQKSYAAEEFLERYTTFKNNMDFIQENNAKNLGYTVAMNEFGDLSSEEFGKLYNGLKMPQDLSEWTNAAEPAQVDAPASYNWVDQGAVTGVKNQGQCGSCWSFSTTGSTEGCHEIAGRGLVGLSEQNLMDCSWSYGNNGCGGGLMTQAMRYIISNGGIDSESSYPYMGQSSHNCQYNAANSQGSLSSFNNVPSGNEAALLSTAVSGPVSVAIDASHSSFQFYSGGVYYEPDCSSTALDHGVLVVGWGSQGSDYWIVKNSWGPGWGLQGYIWMSRNRNNNCGIATMATLPTC